MVLQWKNTLKTGGQKYWKKNQTTKQISHQRFIGVEGLENTKCLPLSSDIDSDRLGHDGGL